MLVYHSTPLSTGYSPAMLLMGRKLQNTIPTFQTQLNPILPRGGGEEYAPLLFFLHHPKTAQGIKPKLSDFKDTLLGNILQVKPVR